MIYEASVEVRIPTKMYAFLSPIGKLRVEIPDNASDEEAAQIIARANRIALQGAQMQFMTINKELKDAAAKKENQGK